MTEIIVMEKEELLKSINELMYEHVNEIKTAILKSHKTIDHKKKYLTENEVADLIKVHVSTVKNYAKKNILKRSYIGTRLLYKYDEIVRRVERLDSQEIYDEIARQVKKNE